jgi:hypothetical protein
MADVKLARLANDDKHEDSWVDLAGYAACGGEVATKQLYDPMRPPPGRSDWFWRNYPGCK